MAVTYTQLKTTAEQPALGNKEPPSKVKPAWWGWRGGKGTWGRYQALGSAPWREEPQLGGPQAVLRSANRDPLAKLTKLGKQTAQGGAHC